LRKWEKLNAPQKNLGAIPLPGESANLRNKKKLKGPGIHLRAAWRRQGVVPWGGAGKLPRAGDFPNSVVSENPFRPWRVQYQGRLAGLPKTPIKKNAPAFRASGADGLVKTLFGPPPTSLRFHGPSILRRRHRTGGLSWGAPITRRVSKLQSGLFVVLILFWPWEAGPETMDGAPRRTSFACLQKD